MITSDLFTNNLPTLFENTGSVTHRIGLTVTDPNHPMVSKRGETIQKTVRVKGDDREKAINSAIAHLRRKGYRVYDHHYIGTMDQGVAENTAAGINKMFNNLGDPVFSNLQRVALLAMQGRQQEASGRLHSVIKDASPAVQKKITDAVNNIKPVTINGKIADSSLLDKSKQHNDWITNTFIPWVQSLLGKQGVAEGSETQRQTLTDKYPNIDELVAQAELRRDPDYNYAEGNAYYRGREAEQHYQRLRQIQRVIQGLNESRNQTHLP